MVSHRLAWVGLPLSLALIACGHAATNGSPSPDASTFTPGACVVTNGTYNPPSRNHLPQGTPITYGTNPPCGGDHYPIWAEWGPHGLPLPAGNWVHNLEHGGIVFLYRCATRAACPDLASKVEAAAAGLPLDPECTAEGASTPRRVVVLPDPDLPASVSVAMVAWGFYYTASCVEPAQMQSFYAAHLGHGAENLCVQGAVGEVPPSDDAAIDGMAQPDVGDSSGVTEAGD